MDATLIIGGIIVVSAIGLYVWISDLCLKHKQLSQILAAEEAARSEAREEAKKNALRVK